MLIGLSGQFERVQKVYSLYSIIWCHSLNVFGKSNIFSMFSSFASVSAMKVINRAVIISNGRNLTKYLPQYKLQSAISQIRNQIRSICIFSGIILGYNLLSFDLQTHMFHFAHSNTYTHTRSAKCCVCSWTEMKAIQITSFLHSWH